MTGEQRQASSALTDVLEALDDHPTSPDLLARELDLPEMHVRALLEEAQTEGLAVDWGEDVWASTWRAKLELEPGFFHLWLPATLAAGSTVTALAVHLHGTSQAGSWLGALWTLAGVSLVLTLWMWSRRGTS